MRGTSISPLAAMALAMSMGAGLRPRPGIREAYPEDFEFTVEDDLPPPEHRRPPEPAPRVLTEADNTRLRLAAEKRWRKAQRQAKGMKTDG